MGAENSRIWGGDLAAVSWAPVGTTYPTDLSPLEAPYKPFGLQDADEGTEETQESEVVEVRAHQGYKIVKSKTVGVKNGFTVTFLEQNGETFGLRYNAATAEAGATEGVTIIRNIEKVENDERQIIIDDFDGTIHSRRIHTRAVVTTKEPLTKKANEATVWKFEFVSMGEIIEITNDPALAALVPAVPAG